MTRRTLAISAVFHFALLAGAVYGQNLQLNATSEVDWQEGILNIDVQADIVGSQSPGDARVAFEERLRREIGGIFLTALYEIYLDSYRTVKRAVETDSTLLTALLDIGGSATPASIHLNTSLRKLTATFEFTFYPDIIRVFATHSYPYDPAVLLEHVPTISYSGIVIYAKGEYPVHGEDPAGRNPEPFNPSLKPKLFNTEMELIAEAEMMDPEYLAQWGTFGYTDSTDYLSRQNRIGTTPIFTMARAIFGDYRTDLLIPNDVADEILATPENRELIRQGRILVICDLSPAE